MKKTLSIFLSLVMLLCSVSAAFEAFSAVYPYLDDEGYYHRLSNGEDMKFVTDFDKMITDFTDKIKKGDKSFYNSDGKMDYYNFASEDARYSYNDNNIKSVRDKLADDIRSAIRDNMKISPVDTGDYFDKNYQILIYNFADLTSAQDSEFTHNGEKHKFYTFRFQIEFEYNTTAEQEQYMNGFAYDFNTVFIPENATDYEKVKTIYDFIVRNCDYDNDVFTGKYDRNTQRYKIAHSAYGAARGNLTDGEDYNWANKNTITSQRVIANYDQGLAVCEGFSQLFYYLCVYNGIPCHIVDGDYTSDSGKASDPHEWNYVWLDDGDGARWFQVDTTFAESKSFKSIDLNSYDYFLCGTENINFGYMNHQQPDPYYEYERSLTDYKITLADISTGLDRDKTIVIRRDTVYEEGGATRSTFIKTDSENVKKIEYEYNPDDKDGDIFKVVDDNTEGFSYTGIKSTYNIIIPYLTGREYNFEISNPADSGDKDFVEVGNYKIDIFGKEETVETSFKVVPLDMSNGNSDNKYKISIFDKNKEYNDKNSDGTVLVGFSGGAIDLDVKIVDKYNNELVKGRDYVTHIYNSERTPDTPQPEAVLDHSGYYHMYIDFMGNYCNSYINIIYVDKIDLSVLRSNAANEFTYIPKPLRSHNEITDTTSYFQKMGQNLKISDGVIGNTEGNISLWINRDYTLAASGGLEYGDRGTITVKALSGSNFLKDATQLDINYVISKKFDISSMSGSSLGTVAFYNGTAFTGFGSLISQLEENVDYRIVDYGDNVNAGESRIVLEGINGCAGRVEYKYFIHPASINYAKVTANTVGNDVSVSMSFNGKNLVKGVDYTETRSYTADGYTISLAGIGNYTDSREINVKIKNAGSNVPSGGAGTSANSGTASNSNTGTSAKPSAKTTKLKKPTISKLTKGRKQFKVKWKKVSGITGYQIQYSTSKKFTKKTTKTVKVKGAKKTSATVKKLKSKKKYYVRIRTYKGKKYSSWSKVKSVKVK